MSLTKSREVIYIAGPFTDPNGVIVAQNCNLANNLAQRVRGFGMVPFVPHTGLAGGKACALFGDCISVSLPELDWEQAMIECREFVQRCDAVLMVEGWERSRGATEERALAKACGIPVFDTFAELVAACLHGTRPEVTMEVPHEG